MTTTCPHCGDNDVKRTAPGAVIDDYACQKCGAGFEKVSPSVTRMAIFGVFTLLTMGVDGGALGTLAASAFGSDDA